MREPAPIAIRESTPADRAFVAHSWHMSYRKCAQFRAIDHAWYHAAQGLIIDALLDRPETTALIACDIEQPDVILGWIVGTPTSRVLHYVFAKRDLRGGQIGTRLLDACFGHRGGIKASSCTAALMRVASYWGVQYDPSTLLASVRPGLRRDDTWMATK